MKITNQLYRNIFSKSIQYLFITTHLLIFLLCIFSFKIINAYKLYISNYNVFLLGIGIISVLLGLNFQGILSTIERPFWRFLHFYFLFNYF